MSTGCFFCFFFKFLFFIYDSHRERERERGRDTGRGRSRLHAESLTWDPRSPGSRPGPKAGAKPLRYPGIPVCFILFYEIESQDEA